MNSLPLSSMTRPKSILVATALNDLDFLLPVATEQAKVTGAMIWLLHVIPPDAYVSTESGAYPTGLKEKAFRTAEETLAGVAFRLKEQNVACAYEVRRWYAVDQIKEFIRERGIERLILGTSSRGKLGKLLIGSVAEELIRSLDIPVCTVGPNSRPLPQGNPRRVIFATSLRIIRSTACSSQLISQPGGWRSSSCSTSPSRIDTTRASRREPGPKSTSS